MTYMSGDSKAQYGGNGEATAFPTGFGFQNNSHVKAVLTIAGVDDPLVEGVDYTLTGAGLEDGTFTFPKAGSARHVLVVGERLTIWLDPPIVQNRTFSNSRSLDLTQFEAGLDFVTMICRSLSERLSRVVMYPVSAQESEVGTPESYLSEVRSSMAAAELAKDAAETARDGAEAAAAQVPDNAGTRLTALESSQSSQDTSINTLTTQVAQTVRSSRILNHALLGGA